MGRRVLGSCLFGGVTFVGWEFRKFVDDGERQRMRSWYNREDASRLGGK
jgi:hypothetical protein